MTIDLTLEAGNHSLSTEFVTANVDRLTLKATTNTGTMRITCSSDSSRLTVFMNVGETKNKGIECSECQNMAATNVGVLTLEEGIFVGHRDMLSSTLIDFNNSKAGVKNCDFYMTKLNDGMKDDSVTGSTLISSRQHTGSQFRKYHHHCEYLYCKQHKSANDYISHLGFGTD